MDSPGPIDQKTTRWLPFVGALQLDLHGMVRSHVVQGWLVLTALFAFGSLMDAVEKSRTASQLLSKVFSSYLLVWSTAAIVISASAVSGESGVVADSILSRGISRYAYILSKYLARLLTVCAVCIVVLVPASYFASAHLQGGVTFGAVAASLSIVLVHMTFLTVLGVTFSIWFDRAIVSIAVLWAICYFLGSICSALDVGFMAPMRLVRTMAELLGGGGSFSDVWQIWMGFGAPSVALCALGALWFARRDV